MSKSGLFLRYSYQGVSLDRRLTVLLLTQNSARLVFRARKVGKSAAVWKHVARVVSSRRERHVLSVTCLSLSERRDCL